MAYRKEQLHATGLLGAQEFHGIWPIGGWPPCGMRRAGNLLAQSFAGSALVRLRLQVAAKLDCLLERVANLFP